jgi:endoglucanase
MMRKNIILSILFKLIFFGGVLFQNCFAQDANNAATLNNECRSVSLETCKLAKSLGRGINMGNMLDAPHEGDWKIRLDPSYITKVTPLFNNVRIPVRWSNNASANEAATLDSFFASRVDRVVDLFLDSGVYVILNMHHYNQLYGDALHRNEFEVGADVIEARFLNMWRQIAERYKDRSPKLIFELLNEPHAKLDSDRWNVLLTKALRIVRETNPTRTVMVGPTYWNAARDLHLLKLPNDRNLIVTVHNYDPFFFTHQGASYLPANPPAGVTCCNEQQQRILTDSLDLAKNWSIKFGYPIYVGEFGSYRVGDIQSRENYTRFARNEIEKRGFGWAYWEFGSSFGMYDPKAGAWVEPLRRALLD